MLNRRQLLERSVQGGSLLALAGLVPHFVFETANAAEQGKDTILVVLEMTGGNDGLNTVVPYGDDLYHKARPTLRLRKEECVRIDDYCGLNPGLRPLEPLLGKGELAIVQGVGYPNPDRSHFESMDIWHMGDPKRQVGTGWLGRGLQTLKISKEGGIPGMYVGAEKLPLALEGSPLGTPTLDPRKPYELQLEGGGRVTAGEGGPPDIQDTAVPATPDSPPPAPAPGKEPPKPDPKVAAHREARMKLLRELTEGTTGGDDLLQFVRRSSVQTFTAVEGLRKLMEEDRRNRRNQGFPFNRNNGDHLAGDLELVSRVIRAGFGTRIFYVSMGGFDTHSNQRNDHRNLLTNVASAVGNFFQQLEGSGDAKRVVVLTFSEFGRRVQENGSKGTDHGAGSCLFVAGPAVQGGLVGKHPSLSDLDAGDLKHHTDFRQVYATLLDGWLGVDSRKVLGSKFDPLPLLKAKG